MLYDQSMLGQEQLFLGMSLGPAPLHFAPFRNGPRDIPRKSCSCPRFDWWYITFCSVSSVHGADSDLDTNKYCRALIL